MRIFVFSSSSKDKSSTWKDYGSYGYGDNDKNNDLERQQVCIGGWEKHKDDVHLSNGDDDSFIPYSEWQEERRRIKEKYNEELRSCLKNNVTNEEVEDVKNFHLNENILKKREYIITSGPLNIANIPEIINEELDEMESLSTIGVSSSDNQENNFGNSLVTSMVEQTKEVNGKKLNNHESRLRVISMYNERKSEVDITIVEGIYMPFDKSQIRVSFVGKKIVKFCTPFREGWNPKFNQTFSLNLKDEDLPKSIIQFRIYTKSNISQSSDSIKKAELIEKKITILEEEVNVLPIAECTLPLSLVDIVDGSETLHNLKLHAVQDKNRGSVPNINLKEFDRMTIGQRKRSNSATGNNFKIQTSMSPMRQNFSTTMANERIPPISPYSNTSTQRGSIFERNSTMHSGNSSRRGSTVDESGRFCSLPMNSDTKADLLVTLCYTASAGQLVVGIEKASANAGAWGIKAPETFVKITLLTQFQEEVAKQKTNNVKESFTPVYDSTFAFEIPKGDIESHSLLIQVFTHYGLLRRKALLGQVILGEAASSPDAQDHWDDMIKGDSITLSKWHTLQGRDEISVSKGGTLKQSS
uniref:C2 domain-containing protein n=1 Tax=Parastrongyloides trichosuri TaxID=131310 RepID=A0A0N4ZLA2_PARTI